jgi:GNAT superfamily N-acetyltransferase
LQIHAAGIRYARCTDYQRLHSRFDRASGRAAWHLLPTALGGFGLFFEAKVAIELASFLSRYDERRDGFWTALVAGNIEGSITIDGNHAAVEGAHLRWFIMSDALQGKGVGNQLMRIAIGFCQSQDYRRVYLWTFEGLNAARHLYEKNGFTLVDQQKGVRWGREVNEQRLEIELG